MARPQLTPVQLKDFRFQVCETALEMIAEEGLEKLTLRGLARRLGCSYAKPYSYFRDKDGLIDAVRGHAFGMFGRFMAGRGIAANVPLRERYLRFAFDHPEAYRLMFELGQATPSEETSAAQAKAWKISAKPFHDAAAEGRLNGDPERLAHVAWAAYHGLVTLALANQLHLGVNAAELADSIGEVMAPLGTPNPDAVEAATRRRGGKK